MKRWRSWRRSRNVELDVARLFARGLSNQEIAQRLFLGEATIKPHLAAATEKLGVTNRVQLAVVVTHAP
ncbi:response regulator transcription factor [Cellulosimicrobium protaetiae]|uniref:Response regulator transcription factor n=1 Tax=Cellulosimicrobium protaetiae TaxID=2587808 RepID=A0A6M5UBN6_9MICO|nr:LuxR C-terminal-related transcriptional regulator [Cellulosimicrobium protaetiae]QJW35494.1 response regulator transcription factor [Cellulosimicrobium protaetiae]